MNRLEKNAAAAMARLYPNQEAATALYLLAGFRDPPPAFSDARDAWVLILGASRNGASVVFERLVVTALERHPENQDLQDWVTHHREQQGQTPSNSSSSVPTSNDIDAALARIGRDLIGAPDDPHQLHAILAQLEWVLAKGMTHATSKQVGDAAALKLRVEAAIQNATRKDETSSPSYARFRSLLSVMALALPMGVYMYQSFYGTPSSAVTMSVVFVGLALGLWLLRAETFYGTSAVLLMTIALAACGTFGVAVSVGNTALETENRFAWLVALGAVVVLALVFALLDAREGKDRPGEHGRLYGFAARLNAALFFVLGMLLGVVIAPMFFFSALARRARPVHQHGVVCRAMLIELDNNVGLRLAGPAIVRLSGAFSADTADGQRRPDILGIALRLQLEGFSEDLRVGDQDLVFGTFESFRTASEDRAKVDPRDFLANEYSSVTPWRVPGLGIMHLRLTAAGSAHVDEGDTRNEVLERRISVGDAEMTLVARRGGHTIALARVVLLQRLDMDGSALRISMFRTGRGFYPTGARNGLRAVGYPVSQLARRLRGG